MNVQCELSFFEGAAIIVAKNSCANSKENDATELENSTSTSLQKQQKIFYSHRKINDSLGQSVTSSPNRAEIIANEMIRQDLQRDLERQQKFEQKTTIAGQTTVPDINIAKKFLFDGLKEKSPPLLSKTETNESVFAGKKENTQIFHQKSMSQSSFQPEKEFISTICGIGNVMTQASKMALAVGGHPRTWKGIANAGNSLVSLSSSIQTIQTAKMGMTVGLGYWGVAVSAFSLALSIFCNDNDDNDDERLWRQHVHSMLQEILNSLQQGFQRVESILIDVVCKKLNAICVKLERLETIMCASFHDLHRKDLVDIVDAIEKDFKGEFVLKSVERRNLLRRLSTWIDYHSNSSIELSQNRLDIENLSVFNELVDVSCPQNSLHILVPLLSSLVPSFKPDCQIPNWELYIFSSKLFAIAQKRWDIHDSVDALFHRIVAKFDHVQKIISLIDENVHACLQRQYRHQQFLIGRLLAKVKIEFGGEKTLQEKLAVLSIQDREQVDKSLQRYELLRRVINCIDTLTKQSGVFGFFFTLPGSTELLSSKTFRQDSVGFLGKKIRNRDPWVTMQDGNYDELEEFLNQGLDVNLHDGWGHLLLRFVRSNKQNPKFLHRLLRCPGIDTNSGSKYSLDTWPIGSRPIQYILNCCNYPLALLFVANGYNIDSGNYGAHWQTGAWGDMGNLHTWAAQNPEKSDSIATLQLVMKMQDTASFLYRDKLRAAYHYYKQYESGQETIYNGSIEALFCIICLLGLIPQNFSLPRLMDIDAPIIDCGLTWLMLAHAAGNWNVEQYLLRRGATSKVLNWQNEKTSLAKTRETAVQEQSEFLKNLAIERHEFTVIAHAFREKFQDSRKKSNNKRRTWLNILEPMVSNNVTLHDQFQICKDSCDEEFLHNLNLLNAYLKTMVNGYVLGSNIDIFIQQEINL